MIRHGLPAPSVPMGIGISSPRFGKLIVLLRTSKFVLMDNVKIHLMVLPIIVIQIKMVIFVWAGVVGMGHQKVCLMN